MTRQILASRVILIATPDDEIALLGRTGADRRRELRGKLYCIPVGHGLSCARCPAMQGATVGSMHPLQSFSGVRCRRWKARFLRLKGNACVRVARQMRERSADRPCTIAGSKKILYHAAAAMAAGHVLALEKRHAVAPLAWDEAERSRARVVAVDAPGSGEFGTLGHARRGPSLSRAITKWCGRIWTHFRNRRKNLRRPTIC